MDEFDAWEIRRRAAAAIADADETLERLARRQAEPAERPEPRMPVIDQPEPVHRAVRRQERPVDGWRDRVEQLIDARLAVLPEGIGRALGQATKQLRGEMIALAEEIGGVTGDLGKKAAEQERHIAGLEDTITNLLSALEHRVAEVERRAAVIRPTKPRLIAGGGGDDAA